MRKNYYSLLEVRVKNLEWIRLLNRREEEAGRGHPGVVFSDRSAAELLKELSAAG